MRNNEESLVIRSTNGLWVIRVFMALGAALLIWLGSTFVQNAFYSKYVQIFDLALGAVFVSAGLFALYTFLFTDVLLIYDDRFVVKSRFGFVKKVIPLHEITMWAEMHKEDKYTKYFRLSIYTHHTSYSFYSLLYGNYATIRGILTLYGKRDYLKLAERHKRNKLLSSIALFVIALGCACLFYNGYTHSQEDYHIKPTDISILKGQLTNKAKITSNKSSKSIHIKLKEFPGFDFVVSGKYYSTVAASSYVAGVAMGDTLYIGVLSSEYHKKITEDTPLGFWDKHLNYPSIAIYSLSDSDTEYFNVSNYNNHHRQGTSNNMIWFFLATVGFFVFCGVQEVKEYMRY